MAGMEIVWSYEHQISFFQLRFTGFKQKIQKMDSEGFHMALNCVKIFGYLFGWKGIFVLIIPFLIIMTRIIRYTIWFIIKESE